jgi:autotransporter-associated beta strand protein
LTSAGHSGTYGQYCKVLSASGSPVLTISNNSDFTFNGVISSGLSLVKAGAGTQTLTNVNTYTGSTTINGGTLLVVSPGSLGAGSAVTNNATLGGNGTINDPTTVTATGTLQPGLGGLDTSTLTINNDLTLGGNALFALNRTNVQNAASVAGIYNLTYGGGLTVTNVGPALQLNDTFTLFSAGSSSGTFAATNLPALSGGLAWNWDPATSVLSVVAGGSSGPATITNSVSGNTLTLTWPAGQGWRLVGQTNSLSIGLSTNWYSVSGASDGSATITINPANPTVFYRLVNP